MPNGTINEPTGKLKTRECVTYYVPSGVIIEIHVDHQDKTEIRLWNTGKGDINPCTNARELVVYDEGVTNG